MIDAAHHIVLPGLANAHTHAGSHLVRGPANWTLEDLLTHTRRTTRSGHRRTSTCRRPSAPSRCSRPAAPRLLRSLHRLARRHRRDVRGGGAGLRGCRGARGAGPGGRRHRLLPDRAGTARPAAPGPATDRGGHRPAPTKGLLDLTARLIKRWHGTAEGRVRVAASPTIPNQATDELLDGFAGRRASTGSASTRTSPSPRSR